MWTNTIQAEFKGRKEFVQVWLSDEDGDSRAIVSVQSMINEYFLLEQVSFDNRDSAYDFIKFYTVSMAKSFLMREGYSTGALN